MQESYIRKLAELPTPDNVNKVKRFVDGVELELRGGGPINGGLKTWDSAKTSAQTGNVIVEGALGTKSLGDAVMEWIKDHYFCCVWSGRACLCFYVAAARIIPGGFTV